jgi:hypothetical protein
MLLFLLLWWETLAPFLPLFRNDSRQRTRHGLRNITVSLLNEKKECRERGSSVTWDVARWSIKQPS